MQIISGKFRGKKLIEFVTDTTRPTTNRVRENIFNIVGSSVRGAVVLDLFAGGGAFSAECESRGARRVVANDVNSRAVEFIKKNTNNTIEIYNLDYRDLLLKLKGQKFDIVFLDPPYDSDYGELALQMLTQFDMLNDGAVAVFECEHELDLNDSVFENFDVKEKKYGRARVYVLTFKSA